MAKKAVIARELKRNRLVEQYADKIAAYKLQLQKAYIDDELGTGDGGNVEDIYKKMRQLPRDAYACRKRSRCFVCGRPNGVYKKVGLCRIHFRIFAMLGYIPGLRKASW